MNNLSAAVVRSQFREVLRRLRDGRANHDYVAAILNKSKWLPVPPPLNQELRAPDLGGHGNRRAAVRRLFLHVGTHKTGTTSFQSYLADNRTRLCQEGVAVATERHHKFGENTNCFALAHRPKSRR
jgi:hypothetical protein